MHKAKRIVIKLGTQVVMALTGKINDTGDTCFALDRLAALTHQCVELTRQGKEVILVSSGAIGLGRQALRKFGSNQPKLPPSQPLPAGGRRTQKRGNQFDTSIDSKSEQLAQPEQWSPSRQLKLNEKQACAAVGQTLLMDAYRGLFEESGLLTAQVLLTASDFADQKHYMNLRQTLETLLTLKVIPVINENDATSVMEIQEERQTHAFGDNDMLSALVASKLNADLLVILTDVAGIYTGNPETCPTAEKLSRIRDLETLQSVDASGQSSLGRGGMSSKLEAAKIAALGGVSVYIASGLEENPLTPLLKSDNSILDPFGKNLSAIHENSQSESAIEWSGTLVDPFSVKSDAF